MWYALKEVPQSIGAIQSLYNGIKIAIKGAVRSLSEHQVVKLNYSILKYIMHV